MWRESGPLSSRIHPSGCLSPYSSSFSSRFLSLAISSTWSPLTATSEASSSATVGRTSSATSGGIGGDEAAAAPEEVEATGETGKPSFSQSGRRRNVGGQRLLQEKAVQLGQHEVLGRLVYLQESVQPVRMVMIPRLQPHLRPLWSFLQSLLPS